MNEENQESKYWQFQHSEREIRGVIVVDVSGWRVSQLLVVLGEDCQADRQTGRPTGGSKAWIHQDKREESRRIHSTTYDWVHSTTSICPDHIDQIIIKTVFVLSVTAIVLPHQRIPPPNLSLISLSTIYLSPSSLLLPLLLLLLPPLSPPLHLPPSHFFFQHLHQLFPPPLSSYPPLLVFNRLPRLLWSSSHHPFFVFSFFLLFFLRPSTINYPEGGKSGHKKIEGKKKKIQYSSPPSYLIILVRFDQLKLSIVRLNPTSDEANLCTKPCSPA